MSSRPIIFQNHHGVLVFAAACIRLRRLGCDIAPAAPWPISGFHLAKGPAIVLAPNVGPTHGTLAPKFPNPAGVRVTANSTLVLSGSGIVVENLSVNGTLVINAAPGANVGSYYFTHIPSCLL